MFRRSSSTMTAIGALVAAILCACSGSKGVGSGDDGGPSDGASDDSSDDASGGGTGSGSSGGDGGIEYYDAPQYAPDGCAYNGVACQTNADCCSGNCTQSVCSAQPHGMRGMEP